MKENWVDCQRVFLVENILSQQTKFGKRIIVFYNYLNFFNKKMQECIKNKFRKNIQVQLISFSYILYSRSNKKIKKRKKIYNFEKKKYS